MHVCIVQKEKYVHLDAICDLRGIAKNKNKHKTKQNKNTFNKLSTKSVYKNCPILY